MNVICEVNAHQAEDHPMAQSLALAPQLHGLRRRTCFLAASPVEFISCCYQLIPLFILHKVPLEIKPARPHKPQAETKQTRS